MAKETASAATARRSVKKSNVLGALLRGLLAAVAVTVRSRAAITCAGIRRKS